MTAIEIPQNLTTTINAYAAARGMDPAAAVERLLTEALEASDQSSAPQDLAGRIRDAYLQVTPAMGRWVSLTDLRPLLAGINRKVLDAEILRLHVAQDLTLIPEENRRSITPEDRAAAIVVGGEPRHLLSINR
jgi:hypothetical protein